MQKMLPRSQMSNQLPELIPYLTRVRITTTQQLSYKCWSGSLFGGRRFAPGLRRARYVREAFRSILTTEKGVGARLAASRMSSMPAAIWWSRSSVACW